MSEQPPRPLDWFKFYPKDFLSSPAVYSMTTEEIGAYCLLLFHSWTDPQCSIPSDDSTLSKLTRTGKRWGRVKVSVLTNFTPIDDSGIRLVNPRLREEWTKAEATRVTRAVAGSAGGTKKAENAKQEPSKRLASAKQMPSKTVAIEEVEREIEGEEDKDHLASLDTHASACEAGSFLPASDLPPNTYTVFPVRKGAKTDAGVWALTTTMLDELDALFPDVDIYTESDRALAWVNAKPSRKKTAGGMMDFLRGWYSRAPKRTSVKPNYSDFTFPGELTDAELAALDPVADVATFVAQCKTHLADPDAVRDFWAEQDKIRLARVSG